MYLYIIVAIAFFLIFAKFRGITAKIASTLSILTSELIVTLDIVSNEPTAGELITEFVIDGRLLQTISQKNVNLAAGGQILQVKQKVSISDIAAATQTGGYTIRVSFFDVDKQRITKLAEKFFSINEQSITQ